MNDGDERFSIYLPPSSAETCRRIARERRLSISMFFRQAATVMAAAHEAERKGQHVGIADDPDKLAARLLALI